MDARDCSLTALFAAYRAGIDQVQANLADFLAANRELERVVLKEGRFALDDLCVLRYLLSAPKRKSMTETAAATQDLEATLRFRFENQELFATKFNFPQDNIIPGKLAGTLGEGLIVMVSDIGQVDLRQTFKRFNGSQKECFHNGVLASEQVRLLLDCQSKATNRLCKMVNVVNMEHVSLFKFNAPKVLQALGQISAHNDVHSPQMMDSIILVNAPPLFNMIFALAKPFLSAATLRKIGHCTRKKTVHGSDASLCPFLAKHKVEDGSKFGI